MRGGAARSSTPMRRHVTLIVYADPSYSESSRRRAARRAVAAASAVLSATRRRQKSTPPASPLLRKERRAPAPFCHKEHTITRRRNATIYRRARDYVAAPHRAIRIVRHTRRAMRQRYMIRSESRTVRRICCREMAARRRKVRAAGRGFCPAHSARQMTREKRATSPRQPALRVAARCRDRADASHTESATQAARIACLRIRHAFTWRHARPPPAPRYYSP